MLLFLLPALRTRHPHRTHGARLQIQPTPEETPPNHNQSKRPGLLLQNSVPPTWPGGGQSCATIQRSLTEVSTFACLIGEILNHRKFHPKLTPFHSFGSLT